ncbi:uncharacterized protein [Battus philenor]|uniref:uncharacterized protein n=1 Tax=Battus philenor TaxID=42288 RepID=UPI0035D0CC44
MSPSWFVLSVALILAVEYATGNLIRGKSDGSAAFTSKDVPVPREDVGDNELGIPEVPSEPAEETTKKCRDIGDFCMNHSDCCSFACLGYLKKCVSGSG